MNVTVDCEICHFPIDLSDPDVQVPPPAWMCGECHRAREFDAIYADADAADGTLDGDIE